MFQVDNRAQRGLLFKHINEPVDYNCFIFYLKNTLYLPSPHPVVNILPKNQILERLARTIRDRIGSELKHIILFGSQARGDQTAESDYDCLVVVEEVTPEILNTVDDIAGDFLYRYNVVFSILPISEIRYHTERYNPLLMNATSECILL